MLVSQFSLMRCLFALILLIAGHAAAQDSAQSDDAPQESGAREHRVDNQDDDQWGSLTGSVRWRGPLPAATPIKVTKNQDVLGEEIPDRSLLVDPETRGIANAVVLIKRQRGKPLPVHPEDARAGELRVEQQIHKGQYVQRVMLVRTHQDFAVRNLDNIGHNTMLLWDQYGGLIPSGPVQEIGKLKVHSMPNKLTCGIHPWMVSYVYVTDHPYVALTGSDGAFTIERLPVGTHTFIFWHERCWWMNNAEAQPAMRKGRFTFEIHAGENRLPPIWLDADLLE